MSTKNSAQAGSLSSLLPPTDGDNKKLNSRTKPLWHFKEHKAAVKVISEIFSFVYLVYIDSIQGYCLVSLGRIESIGNWWWSFRW